MNEHAATLGSLGHSLAQSLANYYLIIIIYNEIFVWLKEQHGKDSAAMQMLIILNSLKVTVK